MAVGGGALRRQGYDEGQLRQRFFDDEARITQALGVDEAERELERLYGARPWRFLGSSVMPESAASSANRTTERRRERQREQRFSELPTYTQRPAAMYRDQEGRQYAPLDAANEPRMAHVTIPRAETARRNRAGYSGRQLDWPRTGAIELLAVDDQDVRVSMCIRQVIVPEGRRASCAVEFTQALPVRESRAVVRARTRQARSDGDSAADDERR